MAAVMNAWRFKTEQPGRWVWQRLAGDAVVSQSELEFGSIEECAVDAERSGYAGIIGAYQPIDQA